MNYTHLAIKRVSAEFTMTIREWLTQDEIDQVNQANKRSEFKHTCATHEFCDPNEAMNQAFKAVIGRDIDPMEMDDLRTISRAWKLSQKNKFNEVK